MNNYEFYLNSLPPMRRGKAKKALEKLQSFDGYFICKRHSYIETRFEEDNIIIDDERQRLYNADNNTFLYFKDVTKTAIDYAKFLIKQGEIS